MVSCKKNEDKAKLDITYNYRIIIIMCMDAVKSPIAEIEKYIYTFKYIFEL